MIRIILLGLAAAISSAVLGVNVYNSLIDAVNWNADIPHSMAIAREYFKIVNPGSFFRIASPLNQLCALVAVIACWRFGRIRYVAIGALVLAVSVDALTFSYFYPRLDVMFNAPLTSADSIRAAVQDWSNMNWFRSGICTVNTVLAMIILVVSSRKSVL